MICGHCREDKPESEFRPSAKTKRGFTSWCISCKREHDKHSNKTDKGRLRTQHYQQGDKFNKSRAKYQASPKGKQAISAFGQRRRARLNDLADTLTTEQWRSTLIYFGNACAVCGSADRLAMDHWIPVSSVLCPGTTHYNVVPLCKSCNSSKNDTLPQDWSGLSETKRQEIEDYLDTLL